MGNKHLHEIVNKDLTIFLEELQNFPVLINKRDIGTIDKIKLESNEEEHYLILIGSKKHKSKIKEVIEIISSHLENEFKIHTKFNMNKIRYGERGAAGWEEHREFSLLLNII